MTITLEEALRRYPDYGIEYEDESPLHQELEGKQALTVELLQELITAVYETGDVFTIENILDELAGVYEVSVPVSPPEIQKKKFCECFYEGEEK